MRGAWKEYAGVPQYCRRCKALIFPDNYFG
jgi:hypothetical protein